MVNDFDVFIFQRAPALDQEAVGIVIAPADVPQFTGSDQAARDRTAGPYDVLGRIAAESIGIAAQVYADTVDLEFLADVPGNDVRVIAAFAQIVVSPFSRLVREVKRLAQIGLIGFIIR